MVEETIGAIIIGALAIAPVLFLFLRRWVSAHARSKEDKERRAKKLTFGRANGNRGAAGATVTNSDLRPNDEPRPIWDRLRLDRRDEEILAAPAADRGISGFTPFRSGAVNGDEAPPPGSPPTVGRSYAHHKPDPDLTWNRISSLPTLKRAIVLSAVLGRPRSLEPWDSDD